MNVVFITMLVFATLYASVVGNMVNKAIKYLEVEHALNTYGSLPSGKRCQHIRQVAKVESKFFSCYLVVAS
jgi:hypothetical protein